MQKIRPLAFSLGLFLVFCAVYKFSPKISTFLPFSTPALADSTLADADADLFSATSLAPADGRFVTIFDGDSKKVLKTDAPTVAELISRLNLTLSPGDLITPSLETEIDSNNFFINIHRAYPILIQDGPRVAVANVSSADPLTAVRSAGFTVFDTDKILLISTENFLETGISTAYQIIRGDGTLITEEDNLPFSTETIKDYNLSPGAEEVRVLGELGKISRTYRAQTINGELVSRELIEEKVLREPVTRVVAVGTAIKNASPLTVGMGRNRYTAKNLAGELVEREETYYDLPMSVVMSFCGGGSYSIRDDGAKVDQDGYVLVAADLSRYPRCSVVETSLGLGKVYDTGGFVSTHPENFDLATDWTNHDGI